MKDKDRMLDEIVLKYFSQKLYNDAIYHLSLALEENPDLCIAWFRLGVAYFEKQDYENSIVSYIRAWEIDPALIGIENLTKLKSKNFFAWWKIGDFFFNKGVYEKALECYDRMLDLNKPPNITINLGNIWSNKGLAHYNMGEMDFAINCYKRALQYDDVDITVLRNKLKILKGIKKKKKCVECGAPLNFKLGRLLGKKKYVIVDVEHLYFLVSKLREKIELLPSYESNKIKKIEERYKKVMNLEGLND